MSREPKSLPVHGARRRRLTRWCLGLTGATLAAVATAWVGLRFVPLPAALFQSPPANVELLDRNGKPLRTARSGDGPYQRAVRYDEIPPALTAATLAAEDHRFWHHPGVDLYASIRAAVQWIAHGRIISGGSTLTQQLIKTADPRPRTLAVKIKEAVQALRLEQVWPKERILAEYLNRIDYGNLNAGCAAAAQFYFSKPLADLSPAECALLAGLPQAPTRLNPHGRFARAQKRQQWILGQMHQLGWLSDGEFIRASAESLKLAKGRRSFEAPHFVDLVLLHSEQTRLGPGPVRTTLDLGLNRFAEKSLRYHLAELRGQRARNGAVVVIDNESGGVLALVGSEDYFEPGMGQVNGAWSARSSGSALKPFTYLLALERGATPATIVADVPTEFSTPTGIFSPVNFNRRCYGPMRYRQALANSLNISAIRVLESIGGAGVLLERLQQCGLTTLKANPTDYGLGLTIGNGEVRLLELANAYASLARLGVYQPYSLLTSPDTKPHGTAIPVHDTPSAYLIADILADNQARSMAFGAENSLRFDFPVACKTGTSSDFRDNWAFGYTPEFTVGVWVGNFNGSPMQGVSGVSGAAPILHDLFEELHRRGTTWYKVPADIVEVTVNPWTGKRVRDGGRGSILEKCITGRLPEEESPTDFDASGRLVLPTEYRDWLASVDNWLGNRACARSESTPRILFPLPGTTIHLSPDLPNQGRILHLKADGGHELVWSSQSIECQRKDQHTVAILIPGRHQLHVTDPISGAQAETWINVMGN